MPVDQFPSPNSWLHRPLPIPALTSSRHPYLSLSKVACSMHEAAWVGGTQDEQGDTRPACLDNRHAGATKSIMADRMGILLAMRS